MSRIPLALLATTLSLLTACGETEEAIDDTGEKGDENSNGSEDVADDGEACAYTATAVAIDETTALGFTAMDLLTAVSGERTEALTYTVGGSSTVEIDLAHADEGFFYMEGTLVEGETDTGTDADIDPEDACPPYLSIPGYLGVATADGAFAEPMAVDIVGFNAETGRVRGELPYAERQGSYAPTSFDPAEFEDVTLSFHLSVTADGSEGEIAISGHQSASGGEGVAFQEQVASWGGDEGVVGEEEE